MRARQLMAVAVACGAMASLASADVFDMGPGLASLEMVHVGSPANPANGAGYGSVPYTYEIGKYEVTAGQYCEFLNAVASTDTHDLYDVNMDRTVNSLGCNITRTGDPGSYTYAVSPDWANRPANFVSWWDAVRFSNWLTNGATASADTESGSYDLSGSAAGPPAREIGAQYVLPNFNEWFKAAYYWTAGSTDGYYTYATGSDSPPTATEAATDPSDAANYGSAVGSVTDVGAYYLTVGPQGTFDMGGNVWEWLQTPSTQDAHFGVMGGGYESPLNRLESARGMDIYGWWGGSDFGFRVALVPEPGTLTLLALGGLALVRRRKR